MHVIDALFANNRREPGQIDAVTAIKQSMSPIHSRMLYTEAYDREYGIFYNVPNEDEEGNEIDAIEMPLVALHWSEDTSVDSPLYESLRSFIRFKVHETTGMTWKELLSLPNDLYEHTLQTCKEKFDADEAKRKQEAEEANKHFQQQTGILGANGLPMGLNLP